MKRLSIGVRLTVWYLAIFALGELVFGAGMWMILRENLYDMVDDDLESQVEDLKNFLQAQKPGIPITKLQEEVHEAYAIEHSGDFLALYAEDGTAVYRSAFLQAHSSPLIPPEQVQKLAYRRNVIEKRTFRFIFEKLTVSGRTYTVEMGLPADDAVETLRLFRSYLLMFAPALLLVAGLFGFWMSRRALSPVDALVQTARQIGGTNLHGRLQNLNTGDELQRLSDTLNEMLDRIEAAFGRVTQFTADASHELRTPVSLMRTEAELALRRSRDENEYRESLRHVLMEAERTSILIEKLLSIARTDAGRETLHLETLDLSENVRTVAESWKQVAALRQLEFAMIQDGQSTFISGDEVLIRRLLDILLDNAFKYTPSPGKVEFSLEQRGDQAVIEVRDSGIGISPEEQDKIFERFYRVDKARSRAQGGTGLGLAIAKWIVAQHHGSIELRSEAGRGSAFRVIVPVVAAPVRNPQPA